MIVIRRVKRSKDKVSRFIEQFNTLPVQLQIDIRGVEMTAAIHSR